MPKHLKKISEELMHQNPWWSYKHDTYQKPNGEAGDYWYGEEQGSVMIVPVAADGSLVCTIQHRYLSDRQSIEFPGGGIQSEKSVLESAKQELYEETGLAGEEWIHIGNFESLVGFFKSKTHVYIAHLNFQGEQQLDDTEEIEVLYRRPDEFQAMVEHHDIFDGRTLATWSLVKHYFLS